MITPNYDLDIDSTLGGNNASDYVIPSQKAIKSYVDNNSVIPSNMVTTDTAQNITGVKTFVGQKMIGFKQSASGNKLGFTLYNNNNVEKGYLEYNPSNLIDNVPLMTLGNYATAAAGLTHVGFRKYSSISGASGAYNLLAPLISDARTPFNLTTTYTNFYLPLGFTDGNTTVLAAKTGLVDLSSLLPSLSGYATETWVGQQGYAVASSLATVATSGSYADLIDTPTIPTVNNATLTITQGGVSKGTFTANASSDVTIELDAGGSGAVTDVQINGTSITSSNVANIITNSAYNSSSNKIATMSDLPTVNNATLTIQKNGTTVKTFTANASSDVTANITVPTKISDLTDDTSTTPIDKADYATSAGTASSATTASTLGSTDVGSATQGIYLDDGTPKACTYTVSKSVPSDAVFTDTDTKVTQSVSSTNSTYPILLCPTANATTDQGATTSIFASGVKVNPSTKTITATTFDGNATTATTASKLGSTTVGGTTTPIYLNAGTPTALSYTIAKSVPADAKFTDTTYSDFVGSGSTAAAGLVPKPPTTAGTSKYLREDGSWQIPPDNNTTYANGTGITIGTGNAINHSNSVTAGTAGTSSATSGSTLAVPYVTYDAQGHVTASGTHTHTVTGFSTTDTKNTAGSTDTSSKIFLVGATSQAANPQTYSHDTAFVDTSGQLNSANPSASTNSTVVATTKWVTDKGYTTNTGTVTSVNNVSPVNGNVSLTIPTVNNATLTIQKNSTNVATFTANASSNVTANIEVPNYFAGGNISIDEVEAVTLPSGYTQVAYIEGTGAQYIDTGWKYSSTYPIKIDCKFIVNNYNGGSGGYPTVYGLQTASYSNWIYPFYINAGNFNPHIGGSAGIDSVPCALGQVYDTSFTINNGTWSRIINGTSTSGTWAGTITNTANMFLFGGSYGTNPINQLIGKIFSFKITVNGSVVRNYIPCKRNSDSVAGMYDLATSTFKPSASGNFLMGSDVTASGEMISATVPTKASQLTNDSNYIANTATGTGGLTIIGTASTAQYATNLGTSSSAGNSAVAVGYNTAANGARSVSIGYNARIGSSTSDAIQIGYGTNSTALSFNVGFYNNSTTHYNWQLLDGTTGLIPDARISSNIVKKSEVWYDSTSSTLYIGVAQS